MGLCTGGISSVESRLEVCRENWRYASLSLDVGLIWDIMNELTCRRARSSWTKFISGSYGYLYWENFKLIVRFRDFLGDFDSVPTFGPYRGIFRKREALWKTNKMSPLRDAFLTQSHLYCDLLNSQKSFQKFLLI